MKTTIEQQTLRTFEGKGAARKRVVTEGYIVKEEGKRIGFFKTLKEAQKAKADHEKNGSAVLGKRFSIESHVQRVRNMKTGEVTKTAGFLLRSDDERYSKFSESKEELQKIIKNALAKNDDFDAGPERLTKEEIAAAKKKKGKKGKK